MQNRRLVRIDISFPLLIDMMSEDYATDGPIRTIEGIPPDSIHTGSTHDPMRDLVSLFFIHESFDEVPHGGLVPTMNISHEVDYTMLDLLHRWDRLLEEIYKEDDPVFNAVMYPRFIDLHKATFDYLHKDEAE